MFLKHTRRTMVLTGVWSFSPDEGKRRSAYEIWSIFVRSYHIVGVATFTLGLRFDGGEAKKKELMDSLYHWLVQITIIYEFVLSRSARIQRLVAKLEKAEREALDASQHEEVRRIYLEGCRYNHKMFFSVMTMISSLLLQVIYITSSMVSDWNKQTKLGLTPNRTLLVMGWYPEIIAKHVVFTLFYQAFNMLLSGLFIIGLEPFILSLVIFPSIRLRMLAKQISLFEYDGDRLKAMETLRRIVKEHQDIIDYVNDLKSSFKWFYFFAFAFKSYHISMALYELHSCIHKRPIDIIFAVGKLTYIFLQVWVVSHTGNELILESESISSSIFSGKWYKHPPEIKRGFIIMSIRSNRPLEIWMGFLRRIDLQGFLQVVKAAYTVIVLSST